MIRCPYHPARSELLYRLSYPGPRYRQKKNIYYGLATGECVVTQVTKDSIIYDEKQIFQAWTKSRKILS